jgi:hypothetical protein
MRFDHEFPEYAAIEAHLHAARAERSFRLAHGLAGALVGAWDRCKRGARALSGRAARPAASIG